MTIRTVAFLGTLILLAAGGCARTPVPPQVPPSAAATPIPADPVVPRPTGDLPRTASVERDGVRVTVALEHNPLAIGEPTWATATVTNTGRDELVWFHDGCAILVGLRGSMPDAHWRDGAAQVRKASTFKHDALDGQGIEDGTVAISFVPERFIGTPRYGCADVGLSDTIAPGATMTARARWDGQAYLRLGPPPPGRVDLIGSFRYYWRKSAGQPDDITRQVIDVPLAAWIVGVRPAMLHPAEAVDAALRDARLAKVLDAREIGSANEPLLRFDPAAMAWQVGLVDHGEQATVHLVSVDARTGIVGTFVERAWDFDVDGYP